MELNPRTCIVDIACSDHHEFREHERCANEYESPAAAQSSEMAADVHCFDEVDHITVGVVLPDMGKIVSNHHPPPLRLCVDHSQ
jgi:hypothetical protein